MWHRRRGQVTTARPVVEFKVTMNYAGQGFPWLCIADLWQEQPAGRIPFALGQDWSVESRAIDLGDRLVRHDPSPQTALPSLARASVTESTLPSRLTGPSPQPTAHSPSAVQPGLREPTDKRAPSQ
jgi:hypothetical protein